MTGISKSQPMPAAQPPDHPERGDIEAFDPAQVRPWRYHNRSDSGMDNAALDDLANSIRRDGQQQPGLARRLPPGETHLVEAIFGVRRLEACRRAETVWLAEVCEASLSDARCAALMHSENEWTEGVSPLENAVQWKAMIDAGVFENQAALAAALGCHRGTVSRAVRAATVLLGKRWIERLVRPVMHDFTGRSADRLAEALADGESAALARDRARAIVPGTLSAHSIYDALLGESKTDRQTLFLRRGRSDGRSVVGAKIERDAAGGWSVQFRPHEQSPAEMAELAERVEALLAVENGRCGRRSAGSPTDLAVERRRRNECRTVMAGRLYLGRRPGQRPQLGPMALHGRRRGSTVSERRVEARGSTRHRWQRRGSCRLVKFLSVKSEFQELGLGESDREVSHRRRSGGQKIRVGLFGPRPTGRCRGRGVPLRRPGRRWRADGHGRAPVAATGRRQWQTAASGGLGCNRTRRIRLWANTADWT